MISFVFTFDCKTSRWYNEKSSSSDDCITWRSVMKELEERLIFLKLKGRFYLVTFNLVFISNSMKLLEIWITFDLTLMDSMSCRVNVSKSGPNDIVFTLFFFIEKRREVEEIKTPVPDEWN